MKEASCEQSVDLALFHFQDVHAKVSPCQTESQCAGDDSWSFLLPLDATGLFKGFSLSPIKHGARRCKMLLVMATGLPRTCREAIGNFHHMRSQHLKCFQFFIWNTTTHQYRSPPRRWCECPATSFPQAIDI